jgi:hypothetical protein
MAASSACSTCCGSCARSQASSSWCRRSARERQRQRRATLRSELTRGDQASRERAARELLTSIEGVLELLPYLFALGDRRRAVPAAAPAVAPGGSESPPVRRAGVRRDAAPSSAARQVGGESLVVGGVGQTVARVGAASSFAVSPVLVGRDSGGGTPGSPDRTPPERGRSQVPDAARGGGVRRDAAPSSAARRRGPVVVPDAAVGGVSPARVSGQSGSPGRTPPLHPPWR